MRPQVAVVVPVYDLRAFVGDAITSVLAQTLPPDAIELIVVDDGSRDGSGDVARSHGPRVQVLRQENRGLPAARNAGIAATSAPFVQLLDADDRLHPEKLAASLARFAAEPDAGVVYTGVRFVDEAGAVLPQHGWSRDEGDVFARLVLGNLVNPHQPLVRRAALEAAGPFDETLTSLEDWDVWLRVARAGWSWRCVDRALVDYRVRAGGMHQHAARMCTNRLRVLDKLFADPALPDAIRALEQEAYLRIWLQAACDHYRGGAREAGARAVREALRRCPTLFADRTRLRALCRMLVPLGHQSEAVVVAHAAAIGRTLQQMLDDAVATPGAGPALGAHRLRAQLAVWATRARLARKRLLGRRDAPADLAYGT